MLALWLTVGRRCGKWGSALGAMMLAGALFSIVIGIVLLPFSIIGLMFLIGALGFSPFFSAFVYLRNGRRALKFSNAEASSPCGTFVSLLLGTLFVIGGTAAAQWSVARVVAEAVDEVMRGGEKC